MIYLIGILCLISLALNYIIYKKVTATYVVGTLEETLAPPAIYCCCSKVEHLEPEQQQEELTPVTVPVVQDVYQAWTNRKEIPWVPPASVPEPIKPSNRGPLERPEGFI